MATLLAKAYQRYSIGTMFESIFNDGGKVREIKPYIPSDEKITFYDCGQGIRVKNGIDCKDGGCTNPLVYEYASKSWAPIVYQKEDVIFSIKQY